jgi:hypothetical protein
VNKCNETSEIAIRDIAIQSQPLRQDLTWTVDLISYRSFANRDMERQKKLCNIYCEIAM